LLEVIIVIAILIVIAGLGVPMLQGTLAQHRLRSAADTLRAEWLDIRTKAMEESQIFSMRCQIGSSAVTVDRILDTHFTAGLSSRSTNRRFEETGELDPFERGRFTGESQDFMVKPPAEVNGASETDTGSIIIRLPETVTVTSVETVTDERSAFYQGLINPAETESTKVGETDDTLREAETATLAGTNTVGAWASPIFFYPDGTTSTTMVTLQNEAGRSMTIRLRGLTGSSSVVAD
jgi:Tfp pilus assembly protein FimT